MAPKKEKTQEVDVVKFSTETIRVAVVGTTPLIMNAMSAKVRQGLLMPSPRKNAAEKAANLKHNPPEEFRGAAYYAHDDNGPTRLVMPSTAFKSAMRDVAADIPGAAKAQIGRLTFVQGVDVPVWGIPRLLMSVVRSADMARTPDVRTRVILDPWAAVFSVTYVTPALKQPSVVALIAAAGMLRGVGDFRAEKGRGNFGSFNIVDPDDAVLKQLQKTSGRDAQIKALAAAEPYDEEATQLLEWWQSEVSRRGFKTAEPTPDLSQIALAPRGARARA